MQRILLLFFILGSPVFVFCQQFIQEKFDISDGLSSDYVFHVSICKQGYLWVATDKGVSRFDGSRFENALDSVMVYRIAELQPGNIWLCSYEHGVIQLDANTMEVQKQIIPKSSVSVYDIKEDEHGRIIIRTFGGLEIIEKDKSTILKDSVNQTPNNHLISITKNKYLFRINGQLTVIKTAKDSFTLNTVTVAPECSQQFKGNSNIYFVGDSFQLRNGVPEGGILLKNFLGVFNLRDTALVLKKYQKLQNATSFCAWDSNIIVSTNDKGLQLFEGNSLKPGAALTNLQSHYVTTVCTDNFNHLWAGTFGEGIYRVSKKNYSLLPEINRAVNAINIDNAGSIYAGTSDGLMVYENGKYKLLANEPEFRRNIRAISFNREGKLYVGTFLSLIGPASVKEFYSNSASIFLHGNGISGIIPNSDGTVWISTYGSGILLLNQHRQVLQEAEDIPSKMVNKLFRVGNAIWGTTDKGLVCYENGISKVFTSKNGLLENFSNYIFEDNDSSIIIGNSRGIQIYNPQTEQFINYAEGFEGSRVVLIFKDNTQRLLVLSDTYLHIFNGGKLIALKSFPILPGSDYKLNDAKYYSKTNELYLATSNGVVVLNLQDAYQQKQIPKLYLARIKTDSIEANPHNQHIILEPDQNTLNLIIGIHYLSSAKKVSWMYKLQGADEEWSEPTTNFHLNYPRLPYGSVSLWAKSINPDGIVSEPQHILSAYIKTPFYRRWYSLMVEIILLIAAIFLVVKYFALRKIKIQMQELRVQQKIQKERQRIARDLHDNVGSQLTYIITNLDRLSNQGNSYAEELSSFGRKAIGQLRETIWAIHSDYTDVEDFIDGIRKMCFQYLNGCKIEHQVQAEVSKVIKLTPIQTLNLYRIAQESVTNIIKHSRATLVEIYIEANSEFTMRIRDNGIGTNGDENRGHGLKNMENRAAEIGASIMLDRKEGQGTVIQVILPSI